MLAASDKGGAKLELDDANELIMAARAHWFDGAEAGAAEPGAVEPGAIEKE
jgi:hypothetical protein